MAKYVMTISTPAGTEIARAGTEFPSPEAKQLGLTEERMEYFVQIGHAKKTLTEKEEKLKIEDIKIEEFSPNEDKLYAPKQFKAHSYTSMKVDVNRSIKEEEVAKKAAEIDSSDATDKEKIADVKEVVDYEKNDIKKTVKQNSGKKGRPKSKSGGKK